MDSAGGTDHLICMTAFYMAASADKAVWKDHTVAGGSTGKRHRGSGDLNSGLHGDKAAVRSVQPDAQAHEAAGGFQTGVCIKRLT